jgi:GNAT superfamily N-acetyltransferase
MYSIRRVPEVDDHIADEIRGMHLLTFGDTLQRSFDPEHCLNGTWWLAYETGMPKEPVAFASIVPSVVMKGYAFMMRSGVLPAHRGHNLQYRLLGARERYARRAGYTGCVTYTIDNPHSANNIIKAGYKTYTPPWEFAPGAIYFIKQF